MDIQVLDRKSVKLIFKIKKHLQATHQIAISIANPDLLSQLIEMSQLDDAIFQDMLADLKVLIGPEKVAALESQEQSISNKEAVTTDVEQSATSTLMYRGQKVKADVIINPMGKPKEKSRRMYRGHPVDD
ncbi:MAG: hypothetical protein KUG63_08690 [Cycloclasticus sp.]|uniref:hypothetical protein n=1 Tax=Cycloclasticus sp. TaxID=2024830 RepID=UPI0025798544|nr:hypothetical protein [Cycloclasticus sp.]MBV1899432.1 hypothetical protein [Cycloclasticus sp.]